MFIDHVIKQNGLGKMLIRGKVKGKRSERRPTVSEEILDHIQTTTNLPLPEFIRTCNNKKIPADGLPNHQFMLVGHKVTYY